jgi:hypothetical protein
MSQYVSQWSSGWYDYQGPELSEEEAAQVREKVSKRIRYMEEKPVEGFRYYNGSPDGIGR